MNILLIKPNIGRKEHALYVDEGRMEPLQLGVLAGLTPDHHDVFIIDDRCETIDFDRGGVDLVAITVETFTARRAYEISDAFRQRGIRVVLGGFHPTLLPEEAMLHADCVVLGDAESIWEKMLTDAEQGTLQPSYTASSMKPQLDTLPRRDLFNGKGYLPLSLMQFGRGCCHACRFCAISSYFKRTHTCRPIGDLVREITTQNPRTIFFVDDNITVNPAAAKALFKALIPLRIQWVSQASIDIVHDRELMDLMVESGCLGNVVGFESLDPANLRQLHKGANLAREYLKEIEGREKEREKSS